MADPEAKRSFIVKINQQLFAKAEHKIAEEFDELAEEHATLSKSGQRIFQYGGDIFAHSQLSSYTTVGPVHPRLRVALRANIATLEKLNRERATVTGYLQRVLMTFATGYQFKAVLPEAVHKIVDNSAFLHGCHFIDTPESAHQLHQFTIDNEKYISLMKRRMLYDLIDA
jgi:hypothetical protein